MKIKLQLKNLLALEITNVSVLDGLYGPSDLLQGSSICEYVQVSMQKYLHVHLKFRARDNLHAPSQADIYCIRIIIVSNKLNSYSSSEIVHYLNWRLSLVLIAIIIEIKL